MSETRPACPKCSRALVYQPHAKAYRCNPCSTTYEAGDTRGFKQVDIQTGAPVVPRVGFRCFVHPRCHDGPALGALTATLEAAGLDCSNLGLSPVDRRGRRELVRTIVKSVVLERMDGSRYAHKAGHPAPECA